MYVSPSSTSQYFNSIIDHLEYLFSNFGSVLVLGDFNCPDIDWPTLSYSSEFSSLLCDFVFKYNLTQEVAVPTHNKGGTLDLAITNSTHLVNRIKVYNDQFLYSDHFLVNLSLSYSNPPTKKLVSTGYNYHKSDFDSMCNFLSEYDFSGCYISVDIDTLGQLFVQLLLRLYPSTLPRLSSTDLHTHGGSLMIQDTRLTVYTLSRENIVSALSQKLPPK